MGLQFLRFFPPQPPAHKPLCLAKKKLKGQRLVSQAAGAGKVSWTEEDVNRVATGIMENLPMTVHQMLENGEWKGGKIVYLDSALQRASAADVAANYHYLKPIIAFSPDRVTFLRFYKLSMPA